MGVETCYVLTVTFAHRRSIRGMLPHKTRRGQCALARLKVFEGVPAPYDRKKRSVVPNALRVTRLRPGRKFCLLGRLSEEVGWGSRDMMKKLEDRRKVRALEFYAKKKALNAARGLAEREVAKPAAMTANGY